MTQTQTVHGEHKTKVKAEETKLIDYLGLNIDRRKHFDTVINWLMRSDASGVGGRIACGPWQTSVSRAVSHRGSASHTQITVYHLLLLSDHLRHYKSPAALLDNHHRTCAISSLLRSVDYRKSWFTSSCTHHSPHHSPCSFALTIYHSLGLLLQTYYTIRLHKSFPP